MPRIIYGRDLAKQINLTRKTRRSKWWDEPFQTWYLTKVKVKGQKRFLYTEARTGISVLTDKIVDDKFCEILDEIVVTMDYLTPEQQHQLDDLITAHKFEYIRNDLSHNQIQDQIKQYLSDKNFQRNLASQLPPNYNDFRQTERLAIDSTLLMALCGEAGLSIIDLVISHVSRDLPLKPQRPAKKMKYWDLKADFVDLRKFEPYQDQPVSKNKKIVEQIKQNNIAIVKQYQKYNRIAFQQLPKSLQNKLLEFLNIFLLNQKINLLTRDLEEINLFVWNYLGFKHLNYLQARSLCDLFADFYRFLSRVGVIRKADADRVRYFLFRQFYNFYDDDQLNSNFDGSEISSGPNLKLINRFLNLFDNSKESLKHEKIPQNLEDMVHLILNGPDDKDLDPQTMKKLLEKANQPHPASLKNNKRNQATYEIRVKLKGFRPSIWRRFEIGGNSSIELLEQTVVAMFHGEFEHMYELHLKRTDQHFERPSFKDPNMASLGVDSINSEEAKVSLLKEGDIANLSYDYGDGWEFSLKVRKVIFGKEQPKYPIILSGRRYGIIEDIGGSLGMQKYYDGYQKGKIDPDLKEWMDDQPIDLEKFDLKTLNASLEKLPLRFDK